VSELKIPKEYEQGIVFIRSLSDSDVNRILDVFRDESLTLDPATIASLVRPILAQRSENEVENFVEALCSLYFLRAHAEVDIGKFIDDLIEAVSESENKQVQTTDPEELAHLRSTFKSLLTVQALSTQTKAQELQRDFANIFWDAKVITDIRPIWDGDVRRPPVGTVVTNTLKLEYHHAGGHGELYVYIDKEDIDTLLSALKRAKNKTATIESLATANWMKILGG
jgi:hypothetical protein